MKSSLRQLLWLLMIVTCTMPVISEAASVTLIEPLCGQSQISGNGAWDLMLAYFNCAVIWLYDIAIGVCVLWTLVGGICIIISGDNSSLYERGKNYIIGSISGLLMLIFAPVILRFVNSGFFT
jgi:Type IV secretion system pilin